MAKKILSFFLFFFTLITLSQEKKILISSRVLDSLGIVKNANIININTKQGTFSSDSGRFKIFASEGDTLQISTIQHITKTISISKEIIADKALIVRLKPNTYVLDEFELKRNNLIGKLAVDIKNVPFNQKITLLKNNMYFSNVDFSVKDQRIDENIRAKSKVVNTVANSYSGLNIGGLIGGLFSSNKLKKTQLRDKKSDNKKAFQDKILTELGEDFFFKELKIPKDKYFHFLEYCNHFRINKIYNKNNILKIIEIFQEESISYLKTLETE
jgi:hypothetical protein